MKNVLIYTRVSTDEQADKGYSLRAQVEKLENYCSQKDINVIARFQDDHSAKTFDRPEFKKLLSYAKANKNRIDALLFIKWDRFSRDATDALNMIRTFLNMGIDCNAIDQPIDLSIPENRLMLAFYITSPQVENERRGLNIRSGIRRANREGRYTSTAPIGYVYDRDSTNKPILVRSDKAPLVEEIFTLYASGNFTKEELRKKYASRGINLASGSFHNMFHNVVYCGLVKLKPDKFNPEEYVQGIHEPIISKEIFDIVQHVAMGKSKVKAKPVKVIEELALRGYLVCSSCGGNLTGSCSKGHGGSYYYYHCQPGCKSRFRADIAHVDFIYWLNSFAVHEEILELYMKIIEDTFKGSEGDKAKEIRRIDLEIEKEKSVLSGLTSKYAMDKIGEFEYNSARDSIMKRMGELSYQKNELITTDPEFKKYMRFGLTLVNTVGSYFNEASLEKKRKVLGLMFSEKLIYEKPEYRTYKTNEIISLFDSVGKAFSGHKKEKVSNNADFLCRVARTGIEPMTFGL